MFRPHIGHLSIQIIAYLLPVQLTNVLWSDRT